jgi:hypothetical protein
MSVLRYHGQDYFSKDIWPCYILLNACEESQLQTQCLQLKESEMQGSLEVGFSAEPRTVRGSEQGRLRHSHSSELPDSVLREENQFCWTSCSPLIQTNGQAHKAVKRTEALAVGENWWKESIQGFAKEPRSRATTQTHHPHCGSWSGKPVFYQNFLASPSVGETENNWQGKACLCMTRFREVWDYIVNFFIIHLDFFHTSI